MTIVKFLTRLYGALLLVGGTVESGGVRNSGTPWDADYGGLWLVTLRRAGR